MDMTMFCAVMLVVCCVSVYAEHYDILQRLLVNRSPYFSIIGSLKVGSSVSCHYTTPLAYFDGDVFDFSCVLMKSSGRVQIYYDDAEVSIVDYDPSVRTVKNQWASHAVGLQLKLQERHNGTRLTCKGSFTNNTGTMVIDVMFTVKPKLLIDNEIHIYINKLHHLYITLPEETANSTYSYRKDELLHFRDNTNFGASCQLTMYNRSAHYNVGKNLPPSAASVAKTCKQTIDPREWTHVLFSYFNKSTNMLLQKLEFAFTELPDYGSIDADMTLGIYFPSNDNIIMKSYRWAGDELIYYRFQDGDDITLQCYTSYRLINMKYILHFDGIFETIRNSIISKVRLTSLDNGLRSVCYLLTEDRETIVRKIIVEYRMEDPNNVPAKSYGIKGTPYEEDFGNVYGGSFDGGSQRSYGSKAQSDEGGPGLEGNYASGIPSISERDLQGNNADFPLSIGSYARAMPSIYGRSLQASDGNNSQGSLPITSEKPKYPLKVEELEHANAGIFTAIIAIEYLKRLNRIVSYITDVHVLTSTTTIPSKSAVTVISTIASPTVSSNVLKSSEIPVSAQLSMIIGSIVVVFVLAVVICVVMCMRKKKIDASPKSCDNNMLIETDDPRPPLALQPDAYRSSTYTYAYATSDQALTVVPPSARHCQHTKVSEYCSSPVYDYAYGRTPKSAGQSRTETLKSQSRISVDSDSTDHYTEIDEYFIKKQNEERLRKKLSRQQML